MSSMKPEVLRTIVTENRSLSPPLINRDKGKVSEVDVLYNRIDQQVELINVLKQRLDEMTRRWERSEAELEQQEVERSKIQQSHNKTADKYSNLEVRWHQLSENHKEMILLKDDYKGKCRVLGDRLKNLEAGESAALASEQRKYQNMMKIVSELKENATKQMNRQSSLEGRIKELESTVSKQKEREAELLYFLEKARSKHLESVSQYEIKLDDNNTVLTENKNQNVELTKQISNLTEQIISRGKLVQDKEAAAKKAESDKQKVVDQNQKLAKELSSLKESINSNRFVKDLREELTEEKERFRKLEIQLERFKAAAKEQILKEKSVNEELRHVSSYRA